MVHVALVKPSVMQEVVEMKKMIQLKIQNHQKFLETILTTVLHGLFFQILQTMISLRA